jgi:hypothetical protein
MDEVGLFWAIVIIGVLLATVYLYYHLDDIHDMAIHLLDVEIKRKGKNR